MPFKITDLMIMVLPTKDGIVECGNSCADATCTATDCHGCSDNTGCTANTAGVDSVDCVDWMVDPAELVELQAILERALARVQVATLEQQLRPRKVDREKVAQVKPIGKKMNAALSELRAKTVRTRKSAR